MTTLVTGSAGHLGEAMMRTLRTAGRPARGLDVKPGAFVDEVASILDRDAVRRAMRGVDEVVHAATLHKPHVATHAKQDFVDVNVTGTLTVLEAAAEAGVRRFVFTSTTSVFGAALSPAPGEPAAWIDEGVVPVPKNIYGATKAAAEDLCALAHLERGLACVVLRTSRFFPEADDDPVARAAWEDGNLKTNELLHRRVDLEDVVSAHLLALERAEAIGFGTFVVSATTPFEREDATELRHNAPRVLSRRVPAYEGIYARRGWRMPESLDRVYDNARARAMLGWRPRWDFARALARLEAGEPAQSDLALAVGAKGYHAETFKGAPYPVSAEARS